jgi:sugar phosphate isomerase/epimerase
MNIPYAVWSSYFVDLSPEDMVDEFIKAGYFCTEFSDEHGVEGQILFGRV